MQSTLSSFKYAISGFRDAIKSEPNLSVHFLFAVIALIFAYFLEFNLVEFAILIIIIFFVIILELINTIVEKIVDMYSLKRSEAARQIKDISATVVLLGAVASIIVALFLFLPKL